MKTFIRVTLLLAALLLPGAWSAGRGAPAPALAAPGDDLDATLARAAVKGYLTSLKYTSGAQSSLTSFYLAAEAANSEAAQTLSARQIDAFQITGHSQPNDSTYRFTATLSPGNLTIVAETQKTTGHWQITSLAWGQTPPPAQSAPQSAAAATAEVVAWMLNVRAGPGMVYPVQSTLSKGETVDITGVSAPGTWYQVARNGQAIGWISALPQYTIPTPFHADIPVVPAPPVPSGGGTLILQTKSGGEFYLFNPNTATLRPLSRGIDPALSPDGTKIAFTRWNTEADGAVWLYDMTTGNEWPVLGEIKQPKAPTWSPDGTKLVVNYQHGGRLQIERKCYKMRSDGSFRPLPDRAYDIEFTGQELCFKLPVDTFWQLREIDLAAGAYRDLASQTYSYAPAWDPANPWRVVFAAGPGLQQLDLNRNEYFPFGEQDLRDHGPAFSPDGSTVAVSYKQHRHWEIYTVDAATGERARLTVPPPLGEQYNSAAPAWSPNGRQIAFVTDRRGQWEFWVMNADGSDPHPLLPPEVAAQLAVEYHSVDERLISWGK